MRVLDLFSGIGGFSLGLERTGGFQTDPLCREALADHWPEVPCDSDITIVQKVAALLYDRMGTKPPAPNPARAPLPPRRMPEPQAVAAPPDEATVIARYIADRGVTRCPPAFAAPSQQVAISETEIAARLRSVTIADHRIRPGESRRAWYRRVGGTHAGKAR